MEPTQADVIKCGHGDGETKGMSDRESPKSKMYQLSPTLMSCQENAVQTYTYKYTANNYFMYDYICMIIRRSGHKRLGRHPKRKRT